MKKKTKRTSLSYMIAAARKIWRWTPERKAVIDRCRIYDKFKCEKCGDELGMIEKRTKKGLTFVMPIQVDHKNPVGSQPQTWIEFANWLSRLFCPIENLWGICLKCHHKKTNGENTGRRKKKKLEVTSEDLDKFAEHFRG